MALTDPDFANLRRQWNRGWPLLLAFMLGAALGLWWDKEARLRAVSGSSGIRAQLTELQEQHGNLQKALAKANADLVVAYGRDEQNRKSLADLTSQLANAQQELAFFNSVVNPDSTSNGLMIEGVELQPLAAPRSYRFRLVVVQRGEHDKAVSAQVRVAVEGSDGLSPTTHDLLELAGLSADARRLSLRYFQILEGTAVLPEGFAPSRLTVKVQRSAARGLASTSAERSFVWADLVGDESVAPVVDEAEGDGESQPEATPSAIVEQNSQE